MKDEATLSYPPLNLPAADLRIESGDSGYTVFDPLRRRRVRLTPEEWVRQHFTAYLIQHKGYPAGLLGNEVSLTINGMTRRCDSVLYGLDRQPQMIIEYKAPSVKITPKVLEQVATYNLLLHVDYLVMSNGLTHYCCKMDYESKKYVFLSEIPAYENL